MSKKRSFAPFFTALTCFTFQIFTMESDTHPPHTDNNTTDNNALVPFFERIDEKLEKLENQHFKNGYTNSAAKEKLQDKEKRNQKLQLSNALLETHLALIRFKNSPGPTPIKSSHPNNLESKPTVGNTTDKKYDKKNKK